METIAPVALVAGVGPGLGAALCRRLAQAGYAVAGLARGAAFARQLEREIGDAGGRMAAFACDVADAAAVERTFGDVERALGAVSVLVYNAGQFLMKPFADTAPSEFEAAWRVNCAGAFLCAQRALPAMLQRGAGAMVFTGATGGVKAGAHFAAFGSAKFALRGLAQSLARELGPRGIHVAHVVIDGIIWSERARQRGARQAQCLMPEAVAETYLQLIRQDRCAWTHELDIRPDVELF